MTEYEILVRLSETPDHQLRMAQLAESLAHSRSRVTHTVKRLEDAGLQISARTQSENLVEMAERADHPWFFGCQYHPEFTSTPRDGHPLFTGFIKAALAHQEQHHEQHHEQHQEQSK